MKRIIKTPIKRVVLRVEIDEHQKFIQKGLRQKFNLVDEKRAYEIMNEEIGLTLSDIREKNLMGTPKEDIQAEKSPFPKWLQWVFAIITAAGAIVGILGYFHIAPPLP